MYDFFFTWVYRVAVSFSVTICKVASGLLWLDLRHRVLCLFFDTLPGQALHLCEDTRQLQACWSTKNESHLILTTLSRRLTSRSACLRRFLDCRFFSSAVQASKDTEEVKLVSQPPSHEKARWGLIYLIVPYRQLQMGTGNKPAWSSFTLRRLRARLICRIFLASALCLSRTSATMGMSTCISFTAEINSTQERISALIVCLYAWEEYWYCLNWRRYKSQPVHLHNLFVCRFSDWSQQAASVEWVQQHAIDRHRPVCAF